MQITKLNKYHSSNQKKTILDTITAFKAPTAEIFVNLAINMPSNPTSSSSDSGVTGAAKFVTSTLGNTVGGLSRTAGNVTGAASRGIGDTITSATGSAGQPVGDALGNIGTAVENGVSDVAKGVERAGEWKSS